MKWDMNSIGTRSFAVLGSAWLFVQVFFYHTPHYRYAIHAAIIFLVAIWVLVSSAMMLARRASDGVGCSYFIKILVSWAVIVGLGGGMGVIIDIVERRRFDRFISELRMTTCNAADARGWEEQIKSKICLTDGCDVLVHCDKMHYRVVVVRRGTLDPFDETVR
jgi:hypothetical protein